MTLLDSFGERLAAARRKAGLEQSELASRVGVHPKTVSRWEHNRQPPDLANIEKLAEALGVEVEWLRRGEVPSSLPEPSERHARPDMVVQRTADQIVVIEAKAGLQFPRRLAVIAAEFIVEADRHGATDEDMAYIRRALESPETAQLFRGGYGGRDLTAEEQEIEMRSLVEMLRRWLQERVRRRNEARRRD